MGQLLLIHVYKSELARINVTKNSTNTLLMEQLLLILSKIFMCSYEN